MLGAVPFRPSILELFSYIALAPLAVLCRTHCWSSGWTIPDALKCQGISSNRKDSFQQLLTHICGNNDKRFQVSFLHVLGHCVEIFFIMFQQVGCATLCSLDLLPVLLGVGVQKGTTHFNDVLGTKININLNDQNTQYKATEGVQLARFQVRNIVNDLHYT